VIEPGEALEAIRDQLRRLVLPHVEDEGARSVVFAALGILGDLAPRVRADDRWCLASGEELAATLSRIDPLLVDRPQLAEHLASAVRAAAAVQSDAPATAREILMRAAEEVFAEVWRDEGLRESERLVGGLRDVLARDLARQLEMTK
jgi:hypothetical protein